MPTDRLALQAVKYAQRDGWSLRDLLRLAHPVTDSLGQRALFDWIAHPDKAEALANAREASALIEGVARLRSSQGVEAAADAIVRFSLPREAVPTALLQEQRVWDALLVDMPLTALIRNLGKLSSVGLVTAGSAAAAHVVERLLDREALAKARVHPIQLLLALRTYARGQGVRGALKWTPAPEILDALDQAFDASFAQVEGSGKRLLVAIDVSGSMSVPVAGSPVLSASEAAAAMAVQLVRTEPSVQVVSFDTGVRSEAVSQRQRLDDVVAQFATRWGGTDLAQPVIYALERKLPVDAFVVLTDHETWAGRRHAAQALADYRRRINPEAKVVLLATAANHGQVIDPGRSSGFRRRRF